MLNRVNITIAFCAVTMIFSTAAAAQDSCDVLLQAKFIESAPRDNFIFENLSNDTWKIRTINIDLTGSAGKLIFDTKDGGSGIEVFQPYRTESGNTMLAEVIEPTDGGKTMQLNFSDFSTGQSFRFSIDVDDTLERSELRQIRVTGSELTGATVTVEFSNDKQPDAEPLLATGIYDQTNTATVKDNEC